MSDDVGDEFQHLWPVPGQQVLTGGNDYDFLAFLQWQHSPEMREYGYIAGFRQAAELMFKHVRETGHDQDVLVFPFGLCWRHHMELQLKSLLMELQRYQRRKVEVPRTHDLMTLWRKVRPLLEESRPDEPAEDVPAVEELLAQLHNADSSAQEFRYPTLRDQRPSLSGIEQIDLAAFHDAMHRLSNFFDGAGTAIYEDTRMRDEYEDWISQDHEGW